MARKIKAGTQKSDMIEKGGWVAGFARRQVGELYEAEKMRDY
jgi:hypothetical protein